MGTELCYRIKIKGVGSTFIDFPVSTPTKVTKAVLRAKTTKERLNILEEMMNLDDDTLKEIEKKLNHPDIVLEEI